MTISFRSPTLNDSSLLLEWRSQSRINEMMFSDVQSFDEEKQREWLLSCDRREDYMHFMIIGDGEPIGIILSAEKDEVMVEYAMGGISNKIFVSKYQLYLPDKKQLQKKIKAIIQQK